MDAEFREFVEARYMELLRMAYLLTGSSHEAEDLLQSALVKVMRRWQRVDDPMAYLRRALVHQNISMWRRFRMREIVTEVLPERSEHDPADVVAQRHSLHAALLELPPRMRAVVVLRYVADLPEAEVATMLGCSAGSVKAQASRGLARLREALQPAELTDLASYAGGTR
jgi:RNA polymerase sigma-70 factor (sigma-E family)